ncbi:MAG: redoxin domain-containing protein [Bacteroidota bacterium]
MRRTLLTLTALFFLTLSALATNGYEIKVKINGFQEKQIYLGYHYGDKQYIKDTVSMDASGYFTFEGEEPLDAGVYLVIMPPDNQYFEILVDEKSQQFSVETKREDPVEHIKIQGSKDNQVFYDYLKYLSSMIPKQKELVEKKKVADGTAKMEEVNQKLNALDQQVKQYHKDLIQKNPKYMSTVVIKPRLEIEMPAFEGDEKSVSMQRYLYYKEHYFDNVDLSDPRVLRTPFLFKRVTYFEEKLTPQHPDSLIQSIDFVLKKMQPSEETFKYYLIHFFNKYLKSKVVGMDAVAVHLAENYYCKGLAPWVEEERLLKICDNARRAKPTLIGRKARNITTKDRNGKDRQLYDVKTDYTILYFWAPDCGHCKKMTPFLIDFHEKWKDKSVSIFTICKPKSGEYEECWEYIDEKENMDKMMHTYDPSQRAQVYYNIRSTPSLFILNKNKEIISKGIGADQLDEVMDQIILRDQENMNKEK